MSKEKRKLILTRGGFGVAKLSEECIKKNYGKIMFCITGDKKYLKKKESNDK